MLLLSTLSLMLFPSWVQAVSHMGDLAATVAAMGALQHCDVQLSFSGREAHLKPLVDEIASKLDNEATKGVFEVDMDDAIKNPIILDYTKNLPRCSMFMFVTDNPLILKAYLDVRGRQGLFHKTRKHLFVTSNELVTDVVYINEEFQYHGHTVLYHFDRVTCLEDYNDLIDYNDIEVPTRIRCTLFGYHFDTFESFRPLLFTVIDALPETAERLTTLGVYPDFLSDMKGYNYTVAALSYFPFVWKRGDEYSGLEVDMTNYLADRNNFSYHIVNPPDGAWGSPDENGTWSGLIGHALYGKSNWSFSGIAVLPEREGAIDFSYHYLPEYLDWVTTKAKPEDKWMAIFRPFTPITWIFIFSFAFASGPVLAILVYYSEYDPINNVYGVWRCVIYVFSVFFINNTVESTTLPQKPAPQIYLLGWWLFCIVGAVSYNGNLVSFMTNPLLLEPIDTPTKILKEGVQVGMYNYQGSTTLAFKSTTNPEYKQIFEEKQWITSFGDSYLKSITGEMIFMDYRFALTAAMETTYTDALGRPKLHLAGFNMFRFGTATAMQPRGMFIETLNQGMLQAAMHGYYDFWMRKNIFEKKAIATAAKSPEERFYQYGSEPKVTALSLNDLGGPFFIGLIGLGVSVLGFIGETTIGCNWGATSARGVRSPDGAKKQFNFGG